MLATVKAYRAAQRELLATSLASVSERVPEYLRDSLPIQVFVGPDFVAVRYDKPDGVKKSSIGLVAEPLRDCARAISQNYFRCADTALKDGERGIEFNILRSSPGGDQEEVLRAGVEVVIDQGAGVANHRPICRASATGTFDLALEGVMLPVGVEDEAMGRRFVTKTSLQLPVDWLALEIFDRNPEELWDPAKAPAWASEDLWRYVARTHIESEAWARLDPYANARVIVAQLIEEFEALFASKEEVLQQFLTSHPHLLVASHTRVWPKLPFGKHVSDFVFQLPDKDYVLVELEAPGRQLFRADGHPTADLTHALGQTIDWSRYIEDNLSTVRGELGLEGITSTPQCLIVIGRDAELDDANERKLRTMLARHHRVDVVTYDGLVRRIRSTVENLMGPLWNAGASTRVYYPPAMALEKRPP